MACTTTFDSILRKKWMATIVEQHTFGTRENSQINQLPVSCDAIIYLL